MTSALLVAAGIGWSLAAIAGVWARHLHADLKEAEASEKRALAQLELNAGLLRDVRARLGDLVANRRQERSETAARHNRETGLIWDRVHALHEAYEGELHALNVTLGEEARRRIRDAAGSPLRLLLSDKNAGSGSPDSVPDGSPASPGGVDPGPGERG